MREWWVGGWWCWGLGCRWWVMGHGVSEANGGENFRGWDAWAVVAVGCSGFLCHGAVDQDALKKLRIGVRRKGKVVLRWELWGGARVG